MQNGHNLKMLKKSDFMVRSNYCGIMSGKFLDEILLERINNEVYPKLLDQLAGFESNRSCADR